VVCVGAVALVLTLGVLGDVHSHPVWVWLTGAAWLLGSLLVGAAASYGAFLRWPPPPPHGASWSLGVRKQRADTSSLGKAVLEAL
jgi:hypothetical protein